MRTTIQPSTLQPHCFPVDLTNFQGRIESWRAPHSPRPQYRLVVAATVTTRMWSLAPVRVHARTSPLPPESGSGGSSSKMFIWRRSRTSAADADGTLLGKLFRIVGAGSSQRDAGKQTEKHRPSSAAGCCPELLRQGLEKGSGSRETDILLCSSRRRG
jgi:hypothetical protein